MTSQVEFFFDVGSPASYLAWTQLPKLCTDAGAELKLRPMLLGGVFQATGNASPVTVPAKGAYMLDDLQRFARRYGVAFQHNPHFPINTLTLMRGAAGLQLREPERLVPYVDAVFRAIWVDARNMNDPATVGRALPGVEVRIGENRELQVRGAIVMKGYLNRPEDTAKTVSADGWLGTGDQAAIEQGRIRILGRIKEIIVTSTGEKVPPADLELALTGDALFEQAFVLGEQRPFIAAVLVLNPTVWAHVAQSLQLDPNDPASLQAPAAVQAALARIQQAAASFPHYAVPRKVRLTLDPWNIENGMMTPTLKLKRNNLMTRFAAEIELLYQR